MRLLKLTLLLGLFVSLVSACVAVPKAAGTLTLAEDGKSSYVIVLGADAIESEKTAAQQLQDNLQKVTGVNLPIKSEAEVKASAPQILVGLSARVRRLLPHQDWKALGSDGIVLQTSGPNLILAGGRPRGALYAVFEFLEKQVGCRWWAPGESTIPKTSTLQIPLQNMVYAPAIRTRELFFNSLHQDSLFATQMRNNGHYQRQDEKLGGHNSLLGWCHTFDQLLPPEKYFKVHPEWYSDPANGGKPCTAASKMPHSQLDLTNDEMRRELTKNALEWIAQNPQAGMISISQNDNLLYSKSPGDMAIIEREGSPSGPLLHFVNQVAEDIEKVYPDFLVETLAYQYTRKAPKNIRPRKNVVIRLCSFEASFIKPLNHASNADFRDDVLAWKAISPQLYIWDYSTNFNNVIFPYPNWRVLAPNIRFFAANNVIGVFEQGDAYSNGTGDFTQLRVWLMSHLLWNPQRDEKQLTAEFMNGYYGLAGSYLSQYLNLVTNSFEAQGSRLTIGGGNSMFLSLDVMNQATALFAAAAKPVEGDEVLSKRVRRARLPLDHAWILRYYSLYREAQLEDKEFLGPQDISAYADDFIATAHSFGVGQYRENAPFSDYAPLLKARLTPPAPPMPLPPELQARVAPGTEAQNVIDLQQTEFRIMGEGNWAKIVDDPTASDQKAARMRGDIVQWSVQCPVSPKGKWQIYVVARTEVDRDAPQTGGAFSTGIYDEARKTGLTGVQKLVDEFDDETYRLVDLGVRELNPDTYIWVETRANPRVKAVYVDRIILLRASDTVTP